MRIVSGTLENPRRHLGAEAQLGAGRENERRNRAQMHLPARATCRRAKQVRNGRYRYALDGNRVGIAQDSAGIEHARGVSNAGDLELVRPDARELV